nr:MAG TPA: hypothetical protein [Caudoviricetes sp.]
MFFVYFLSKKVSSLLFIIRVLCYSLLKRVNSLLFYYYCYSERSERIYSLLSFFLRK